MFQSTLSRQYRVRGWRWNEINFHFVLLPVPGMLVLATLPVQIFISVQLGLAWQDKISVAFPLVIHHQEPCRGFHQLSPYLPIYPSTYLPIAGLRLGEKTTYNEALKLLIKWLSRKTGTKWYHTTLSAVSRFRLFADSQQSQACLMWSESGTGSDMAGGIIRLLANWIKKITICQ